jgi:hypothetical protein
MLIRIWIQDTVATMVRKKINTFYVVKRQNVPSVGLGASGARKSFHGGLKRKYTAFFRKNSFSTVFFFSLNFQKHVFSPDSRKILDPDRVKGIRILSTVLVIYID